MATLPSEMKQNEKIKIDIFTDDNQDHDEFFEKQKDMSQMSDITKRIITGA